MPKRGPLARQPRVVVVITGAAPPEAWTEWAAYQAHYLLALDLAQASGAFGRLAGRGRE